MLSGLRARIDKSEIYELNTMRAGTMVLARVLVGAGAACVLYLFFFSGLVTGSAFPDFTKLHPCAGAAQPERDCVPAKTIAILVVWCFIAGFSEKLVPGLLDNTGSQLEKRAKRSNGSSRDRYRPTEPSPAQAVATNGNAP